ncbi:MAG: glycosyl hydrolase [Dehalococcoidia bacterium]
MKRVFNLGNDIGNNPFAIDAYPGDDYVDMIGWDAYGGGAGRWKLDFQRTRVLSKERPMLIGGSLRICELGLDGAHADREEEPHRRGVVRRGSLPRSPSTAPSSRSGG